MKKHLKFILYLTAIALVAVLIFNLKKTGGYSKAPALETIITKEFLGIKLLDIFLGVLGLAFVAVAAGYVTSLVKGEGAKKPDELAAALAEATGSAKELPRKKLALEKVLGWTGSRIFSALVVTIFILVVVALLVMVVFLLFPQKLPFLQDLFTGD